MNIPDNRLANWTGNVGVPGGIPTRATQFVDLVTDRGADPTGGEDIGGTNGILHQAIIDCPANQVIYIPAGTFLLDSLVNAGFKDNYTIRGAGTGQTIIKYGTSGSSIAITVGNAQSPGPGTDSLITAGLEKGSTQFTVSDTTSAHPGFFVGLAPTLPVWAKNLGSEEGEAYRTLKMTHRITAKTSTTISFEPPLPHDFTGYDDVRVIIWYPGSPPGMDGGHHVTEGVGFEDLTLDLSESPASVAAQFLRTYGCWMKNVEITGSNQRQVLLTQAMRTEFRQMYVHGVRSAGPNHEGIAFTDMSNWNLVIDSIFYNGGAAPVIFGDAYGACVGNVAAYNVAIGTTGGFWDFSSNHAPHCMLNLFEGNYFDDYKDDGYFGSSSHMTIHRNRIRNQIALKRFSNYYNITGNVIGTDSEIFIYDHTGELNSIRPINSVYEASINGYNSANWPIYELGYPNIGNTGYTGTLAATTPPDYTATGYEIAGNQARDMNVAATLLRFKNYDYVNNAILTDAGLDDEEELVDSYLYTVEPDWWPDGPPWPPFDPEFPERGMTSIPAGVRLDAILNPPSAVVSITTLNVGTLNAG